MASSSRFNGNSIETSICIDSDSETDDTPSLHIPRVLPDRRLRTFRDTRTLGEMTREVLKESNHSKDRLLITHRNQEEQEEMIIDNPFIPPPPISSLFPSAKPGSFLALEGPKGMLMIEAPPATRRAGESEERELPRVVDRMDDIIEPTRREEACHSATPDGGEHGEPRGVPMEMNENEEEAVETDNEDVKVAEHHFKVKVVRKRNTAVKSRKVGGARAPQLPVYRYPAGKMTAEEFIAAADTFHLVIEQEGSAGRIGRALLEFDLKPRKFSTGSYGWCGVVQGTLPTNKGNVNIRTSVNLIVKGSKPVVVAPKVPAGRK